MKEEELNKKLEELQVLQHTIQTILAQKQTIQLQLSEIDNAINELEKLDESKRVYKLIGTLLVEKNKNELLSELKEKKEILEIRLSALQKQEERTKSKIQEIQKYFMESKK